MVVDISPSDEGHGFVGPYVRVWGWGRGGGWGEEGGNPDFQTGVHVVEIENPQ